MRNYSIAILAGLFLLGGDAQAQRKGRGSTTTVIAQNYDVSDNLDLQAVASIFGESNDLEDFERRLNNPEYQISNLDLNKDGYVDYLRVIEVPDDDNRIIVVQAVLGKDLFQDVATIELERRVNQQRNTVVNVQIVGNPYLYGHNYIYEPIYYHRPVFFDYFWMSTYRPYCSPWHWGHYPSYYYYWAPMPVYRYVHHIRPIVNVRNEYRYVETRRISSANRSISNVSGRAYETYNPNRSFTQRNSNVSNRHTLDQTRSISTVSRETAIGDGRNVTNDRDIANSNDRGITTIERGVANTTGRGTVNSTREVSNDRATTFDRSYGHDRSISTNRAVNTNSRQSISVNDRFERGTVNTSDRAVTTNNARIERDSRFNTSTRSTNESSSRNTTIIPRNNTTISRSVNNSVNSNYNTNRGYNTSSSRGSYNTSNSSMSRGMSSGMSRSSGMSSGMSRSGGSISSGGRSVSSGGR